MYGKIPRNMRILMVNAYKYSGAYCTMTMISLLAIPLELPPNAPARASGFNSFLDGLPEYLSRCTALCSKLICYQLIRKIRPNI